MSTPVAFTRLPKGARFSYINSKAVYVVLETHGCGLIAAWEGNKLDFVGQGLFSADESETATKALLVILHE